MKVAQSVQVTLHYLKKELLAHTKHVKEIHMIFSVTRFGYWFLNLKKYNKLHGMNNIKTVTLPSIQNIEQRLETYTVQKETKHAHTDENQFW